MTGFTPFVAGNVLTAAQLNALLPVYVIKLATETVNNSAVLQNDDELVVALSAGRVYRVDLFMQVGGATIPDIQVKWTNTGTMTQVGSRICMGPSINTTDVSATSAAATTVGVLACRTVSFSTSTPYGTDTTTTTAIHETMLISCTVAGNLQVQWAQNVANASNTTVQAGSYLIATPIS